MPRRTPHGAIRTVTIRPSNVSPMAWDRRMQGMVLRTALSLVFAGADPRQYPALIADKVGVPSLDAERYEQMLASWQGPRTSVSGNLLPPRNPEHKLPLAASQRLRAAAALAATNPKVSELPRVESIRKGALDNLLEAMEACVVAGVTSSELATFTALHVAPLALLGADSILAPESGTLRDAFEGPEPANANQGERAVDGRLLATVLSERQSALSSLHPDPWTVRPRIWLTETGQAQGASLTLHNGEPASSLSKDQRRAFLYVARAMRYREISGGEVERVNEVLPPHLLQMVRDNKEVMKLYMRALHRAALEQIRPEDSRAERESCS